MAEITAVPAYSPGYLNATSADWRAVGAVSSAGRRMVQETAVRGVNWWNMISDGGRRVVPETPAGGTTRQPSRCRTQLSGEGCKCAAVAVVSAPAMYRRLPDQRDYVRWRVGAEEGRIMAGLAAEPPDMGGQRAAYRAAGRPDDR